MMLVTVAIRLVSSELRKAKSCPNGYLLSLMAALSGPCLGGPIASLFHSRRLHSRRFQPTPTAFMKR